MTKAVGERELVLGILLEVTENGQYSHLVLRDVLNKYQYLDKKERAFITRVSEGTLEHMIELDYIINQFSKVKVKKMKPVIRNILRSAVYQLKYMDTVPDSAACNEAVKLAVKKGFGSLRGFVNGVLRNVARNLDQIVYPVDPVENLSVRYSMPVWILDLWMKSYSMEIVERMLRQFQSESPLTVRGRVLEDRISENNADKYVSVKEHIKETEEQGEHSDSIAVLKRCLAEEGVHVEQHPYLPYALCISGFDYLGGLKSFQKGLFSVQDISSMLVCEIAAPREGDMVIDVCAAPGGKALHMAEKLLGSGWIEARDLTPYKVDLIQENIERTGLTNITAVRQDATLYDEKSVEKADIVIADLPCSGLGVLGKKTDLKYKLTEEGCKQLAELQREILSVVHRYVKPGGMLVYSTCTINPAENMDNVHWFLKENPQFELENIRDRLCKELQGDVEEDGCLQLLPGVHQSDGFFIACFRKQAR